MLCAVKCGRLDVLRLLLDAYHKAEGEKPPDPLIKSRILTSSVSDSFLVVI